MEWLTPLLGAGIGAGILAILPFFIKRVAWSEFMYKLGVNLRKLGMGYDIPVIGGAAEMNIKIIIFSTFSDGIRSLARGIAGKPRIDDGK